MAKKDKGKIQVREALISWQQIDGKDYISLTDMANWDGDPNAKTRMRNWLKNRNTVDFLALWEEMHNPHFNYAQLDVIRMEISTNAYVISPKRWIEETGAIGIVARAGRYGGTYAHEDIAFEFASWLSPAFKLYLITEFKRLKQAEYGKERLAWNYQRFLSKVNYRLHTDTIRDHILPRLQQRQGGRSKDWLVYAEEADLLNMAVFGMTARQWREENPESAREGNMRDFAEIIQLNVLANLESLNAVLIEQDMDKESRYELLARTALSQYRRLSEQAEQGQLGA